MVTNRNPSDRGLSDVIAIVLIFSVAIMGMTVVYASGIPTLDGQKQTAKLEDTSHGFQIFAENIVDQSTTGSNTRASAIPLHGGALKAGSQTTITVEVDNDGNDDDGDGNDVVYSTTTRPLVYESQTSQTTFLYSSGMLVRSEQTGFNIIQSPNVMASSDGFLFQIIDTEFSDAANYGGAGSATVHSSVTDFTVIGNSTGTHDVDLIVSSNNANAWNRALGQEDNISCSMPDSTTADCDVTSNMDRLYVHRTTIDISLSN